MFTYPSGTSHADYQNNDFEPSFGLPVADNATMDRAYTLCGESFECQFDFLVMGSEAVALSSKSTVQKLEQLIEDIKPGKFKCFHVIFWSGISMKNIILVFK